MVVLGTARYIYWSGVQERLASNCGGPVSANVEFWFLTLIQSWAQPTTASLSLIWRIIKAFLWPINHHLLLPHRFCGTVILSCNFCLWFLKPIVIYCWVLGVFLRTWVILVNQNQDDDNIFFFLLYHQHSEKRYFSLCWWERDIFPSAFTSVSAVSLSFHWVSQTRSVCCRIITFTPFHPVLINRGKK